MVEVLKQGQFMPMPVERQVMIIYAATQGYLDDLPIEAVRPFEQEFHVFIDEKYADLRHQLAATKVLDDAIEAKLAGAIKEFKTRFVAGHSIKLAAV